MDRQPTSDKVRKVTTGQLFSIGFMIGVFIALIVMCVGTWQFNRSLDEFVRDLEELERVIPHYEREADKMLEEARSMHNTVEEAHAEE